MQHLEEVGFAAPSPACKHKFCPEKGLLSAAGMHGRAAAAVLQMLLRPLSLVMVAGIVGFAIRDLAVQRGLSAVSFATLLVVAGCAIVLWTRPELDLSRLRVIEIALFGAVTVNVLLLQYRHLVADASSGDPGLVLSRWILTALAFVLLMSAYGVFVPNNWPRAALVIAPMAIAPIALGAYVLARHPAIAALVEPVLTATKVTDVLLPLAVATMISLLGSILIAQHRSMAFSAREANLYDLRERIGSGGMGEVWLAEHQTLTRPAAIKIIRPEILGNGNARDDHVARRRFEREARATAALRSPNTIEIYDFGVTSEGVFYYVMEYLDGLDLETLVKRYGPLEPARAVKLLTQACASLGEAHEKGLVHRDIKPANIFACRQGSEHDFVKVLDFGLVKQQRLDGDATQLTVDGLTTGTPAFMPPELALHQDHVGPATDIYALGCVAYWLVTGKLVFDQETPMAMVVDHVKTAPAAPSSRSELPIPPDLDAVILRCLEKEPDKRFGSMRELARALRAVPVDEPWDEVQAENWWNLHHPARAALPKAS